jgi:AraC-like DNA-binding protein
MRYLICDSAHPLRYISGGKYFKVKKFIHEKRCIDTFVIFICLKGSIYIRQDGYKFTLKANQYLVLFANHEHQGYLESEGAVSYYWCHFQIKNDDYRIVNHSEFSVLFDYKPGNSSSRLFILPEHGDLSTNVRAIMIFRQLLDISRNNYYSKDLPNYALSFLAMEISQEFIELNFSKNSGVKLNSKMEEIIEWLRINYNQDLSLEKIARRFNYCRNYLTTAFRKYRGVTLMKYILILRLSMAKKMLLNSSEGIKEIAWKAGFGDERVFMKRFKQYEDITPTQYRNAFSRIKLVK